MTMTMTATSTNHRDFLIDMKAKSVGLKPGTLGEIVADALEDAGRTGEAFAVRDRLTNRRPLVYKAKVYRSRYSRIASHLTVEAASRAEAIALLERMAAVQVSRMSAAHSFARKFVSGETKTSVAPEVVNNLCEYASQDGSWKAYSYGNTREYSRWDVDNRY